MRKIELTVDNLFDEYGVSAISVVDNPANESHFVALSKLKDHNIELSEISKEKRILLGAVLIPNQDIKRRDKDGIYEIFFSEDSIQKISEKYHIQKNTDKSTLEHKTELSGMHVVESWIVEDSLRDKSAVYGMNMPKGTWMVSMKVLNDEIWDDYVKKGEIKGFSIEAMLTEMKPKQSEEERLLNEINNLLDSITGN